MGPGFDTQHGRLLELMRQYSFQERDVTLASGKQSNFYVDSKQTVLGAEGHFLAGQLCFALMQKVAPEAEAVGGLTMGADPLASATSLVSFIAGSPIPAFGHARAHRRRRHHHRWLHHQGH